MTELDDVDGVFVNIEVEGSSDREGYVDSAESSRLRVVLPKNVSNFDCLNDITAKNIKQDHRTKYIF